MGGFPLVPQRQKPYKPNMKYIVFLGDGMAVLVPESMEAPLRSPGNPEMGFWISTWADRSFCQTIGPEMLTAQP